MPTVMAANLLEYQGRLQCRNQPQFSREPFLDRFCYACADLLRVQLHLAETKHGYSELLGHSIVPEEAASQPSVDDEPHLSYIKTVEVGELCAAEVLPVVRKTILTFYQR